MRCRAVIFDLDGTLIDSLDDIADSMNRVLERHCLPKLDAQAYKDLVGDGVKMMVMRAFSRAGLNLEEPQPAVEQYLAEYRQCCDRPCRFYPGIHELLDGLQSGSIPMAILSNKTDHFTHYLVDRYFSAWKFTWVSGEKPGLPRKPDPYLALSFAREIDMEPPNIFFVGDSPIDMNTSKQAGMVAVGVSWGFRPASELKACGADIILNHPSELLYWIAETSA